MFGDPRPCPDKEIQKHVVRVFSVDEHLTTLRPFIGVGSLRTLIPQGYARIPVYNPSDMEMVLAFRADLEAIVSLVFIAGKIKTVAALYGSVAGCCIGEVWANGPVPRKGDVGGKRDERECEIVVVVLGAAHGVVYRKYPDARSDVYLVFFNASVLLRDRNGGQAEKTGHEGDTGAFHIAGGFDDSTTVLPPAACVLVLILNNGAKFHLTGQITYPLSGYFILFYAIFSKNSAMYGEKIKIIRELRGFTQEYMADKLGMAQNTYSKIETNQTKLSADILQKVAELLGVSPVDILNNQPAIVNLESNQGTQGIAHIEHYHSFQRELVEKMIASKDEEIKSLKEIIDQLKDVIKSLTK